MIELGALSARIAFHVGPPAYRVGWTDADYAFAGVISGALLADGSAAIGDAGTNEIILIRPDGTVGGVVGGEGQGPGEFRNIVSVTVPGGDTIVVEDDSNARLTYFLNGELVATEPFENPLLAWALEVIGWFRGEMFLRTYAMPTDFQEEWFLGSVVRHRRGTAQFDTITQFENGRRLLPGPPNPFRPSGNSALTNGAVVSVRRDLPTVRVTDLETGGQRLFRWTEEAPPVTDSLWALYVGWAESRRLPAERYSDARRATISEPVPFTGDVRGDAAGRIWVPMFSPDPRRYQRYRIFDRDGSWLGWTTLPDRTQILDIGEDRILAVQRDEFDVEAIVVLPILPVSGD